MADWSRELEDKIAKIRKEVATFLPPKRHQEMYFQVPESVRAVQPSFTNLYRPDVVSLGLVRKDCERGNRYKVVCLHSFLKWYSPKHEPSSTDGTHSKFSSGLGSIWDQFVEGLELDEDVKNASRWYNIDTTYGRISKVKTLLALDALFLVMFLRYCYNKYPKFRLPEPIYRDLHDDASYRLQAEAPGGIWRDIFLIENQVPLHILCKLWTSMPDMNLLFRKEALEVFNNLLREVMKDRYLKFFKSASAGEGRAYVTKALIGKKFLEGHDLVDCLHYVVCCSSSDHQTSDFDVTVAIDDEEEASSPADTIPSAIQLRKAGIRLKSKGCYFIDQIKFEKNLLASPALILPSLRISDRNESLSLFRNLAVFEMWNREQAKPRIGPRMWIITPYLKLMAKLVQSKKDIKQMKKDHVIVVGHGSNYDMYQMWNIMGKRLSCHQNEAWSKMLSKLTDRYESERCQMVADIKRKYFGRWWLSVSWIAGAVLLLLTGLQTAYTMAGYYSSTGRYSNLNASP